MKRILIIEGKKEEVTKKLKQKFEYDGRLIDSVLGTDPTGYKYIDYLGKQLEMMIPKLSGRLGGLNVSQTDSLIDFYSEIIPWFHNNSDRIDANDISKAYDRYWNFYGDDDTDIDKIMGSPKDINSYDVPQFISYLKSVVDLKKSEKQMAKEAKSQAEKIFEDDDVLIVKPESHLASCYYGANTKWCTTTKDSGYHFQKYKRKGDLYYFINKKTNVKMALFTNKKERVNEVWFSTDVEGTMGDLKKNFPNQEEVIDDLTGTYPIFKELRRYVKGDISERELEGLDPLIKSVQEKKPKAQSILNLGFDNDEKVLELFDLSDDDIWFANAISSSYSSYEFIDSYTAQDDFLEGYIIYSVLDDDNLEKLKKISRIILPREEFNLQDDDFLKTLSSELLNLFERETDWIISDYVAEKNSEMSKVANEDVHNELDKVLEKIGMRFRYGSHYDEIQTTIANIAAWAARTDYKGDLHGLIKQLIEENSSNLGGWFENSYEFRNEDYFDSASFNRTASWQLDKIIDSIESNEGEQKLKTYLDLVDRILSKYKVKVWYELPKDKDIIFSIQGIDKDEAKIDLLLRNKKTNEHKRIKVNEETFNNLLYQKELFNIFDN